MRCRVEGYAHEFRWASPAHAAAAQEAMDQRALTAVQIWRKVGEWEHLARMSKAARTDIVMVMFAVIIGHVEIAPEALPIYQMCKPVFFHFCGPVHRGDNFFAFQKPISPLMSWEMCQVSRFPESL